MSNRPFTDASQAQGFVVSQTSNIEAGVYMRRYPSYTFEDLVPVVTEGNEWARTTTYYSGDLRGVTEWISGNADDFPYADVDRAKHEHSHFMRGIGYTWNLEEINVARMLGDNLPDRKAMAARFLAIRFLYFTAMLGSDENGRDEKGWTGLLNDPNVTAVPAAATGTGSSTYWADKTPDNIIADVNEALIGINSESSEVEMANTLLLPTSLLQYIGSRRLTDTSMTILQFLRENNVYTAQTNQPLTIRVNRLLNTAGEDGEARMVAYWRDPLAVRFHLPLPFRFLSPFQISSMAWEVAGIMRTGGTEIRLPGAFRYVDGLAAAPA